MKKPNGNSYFELQNIIDNTDVIYIDDFLKPIAEKIIKKKTLSFADEDEIQKIYPIINARNIRDKKTIISSELYIDEIRNLDEATAGRIKEKAGKYIVHIKRDPSRNYRFKEVEVI
jgi:DNA replication protein DnaC